MAVNVALLEESFDLLAPRVDELVARCYSRLFETAPDTRSLFEHVDMETQKQSVIATLITLRESLRDLSVVVPDLEELGVRHVEYGTRPEHYGIFGGILLETMAEIGGSDWKPEYTASWSEAYQVIQGVMLQGAENKP